MGNRAVAYNIPGHIVDGNNVLEVYKVAGEAVRRARAGEGPTLIECKTYRTRAHSEGMRDAGYRTQEEVDSWKARDPIKTYKQKLLDNGRPSEDFEEIEADTQPLIDDASEFAKNSPWPDAATATRYIYREMTHA